MWKDGEHVDSICLMKYSRCPLCLLFLMLAWIVLPTQGQNLNTQVEHKHTPCLLHISRC